ncbi:MAG: TolC family protein [Proteobacteria bacterium]|nr:TolC family protein [Pseudomonadota bacterium]
MNWQRIAWGILVATGLSSGLAQAQAQEAISLEEAYTLALKNSPQIKAQHYGTEFAQAQVSEAKYYWAPKFSLKSQFGPMPKVLDETQTENDIWSNFFDAWGFTTRNSLEMWMPLFTSMKVYHTHELAKIGLEVENLREQNEVLNVQFDVARAYYGLQLAVAAQDVIKEAGDYIARIEREYEKLMANNDPSVKVTDRYRIDIAKSNLYRVMAQIESSGQYAEQALGVHTQLPLPIVVQEMDFSADSVVLRDLPSVMEMARRYRGDLALLARAEEAADLQAKIQWLQWWPDLVLAAEVYYRFSNAVPKLTIDNFFIKDSYNGYGFGIGLMLRWNLDPVQQVFRVRQADAKAEQTRQRRLLATAGIELEVTKQYHETVQALKNVEITKVSRRSAKRFLTHELLQYEAGDGNVNDLISALTTFIEQRSIYLTVLHDFRVSLVRLQKAVGVPDVDMLIEGQFSETQDD